MKICGHAIILGLERDGSPILYTCTIQNPDAISPHTSPHQSKFEIHPDNESVHCELKIEWEWKKNAKEQGN